VVLLALGCTTSVGGVGEGQEPGSTAAGVPGIGGNGVSGSGGVSSGGSGLGGAAGATGGGATVPAECNTPKAARAPLRRLVRFEYNNTVRDLFGLTTRPADALPGEELGNGFGNDADALGVSRLLVDGYRSVAEQIAKDRTIDAATATTTAGCDPAAMGERPCAERFVADFLARAFRRPPSADELTAYVGAFTRGRELGGDFATGVRAVIARALQSPQFLYRVELGEVVDAARDLARPSAHEMANRLSYLLWGSMPDAPLSTAAQQGQLATAEGIRTQAERMLADPRARDVVRHFHGMLLGTLGLDHLERNAEFYPTYRAGMGALFRQETERFIDDVVWNGSGDLAGVFTAPYTFMNGTLASFYGVPGVTGDTFQKVSLDPSRRAGLLTQASILALTTPGSRTDPVVRGKWVYNKLLCGSIGDPPPNVPKLPEPVPGQGVRERLAAHREMEPCATCHRLMDPIGFGFENFDGVGLWRDQDNGVPVDASGEISVTDAAGPFNGVVELGQKLAQSRDAQTCFVGHWLTFAYGRTETAQDACTRASLEKAFESSKGNVKALLIALTQTEAFLYRPVAVP
jgi:Protein of unknown function (DUF1592)/Protein of unknown function (DUF1588)/Protein of unknown function (DUF1595)/Protein of unknown function (DUF1587)/Protein of unknown function (DUF1585)